MATVKDSIPHVVRTAEDPRQHGMHRTIISRIELVNQNIRLFRLSLVDGPVRHLPGQYVDLHIPNIETIGGFTITSPPVAALAARQTIPYSATATKEDPYPFIELAIQRSPNNPPAAYLYQDPPDILDKSVFIRIGGSFAYPPSTLNLAEFQKISNVVFIAGGVGINPIMSMISSMDIAGPSRLDGMKKRVRILYSSKREYVSRNSDAAPIGDEILFERRLRAIAKRYESSSDIDLRYTFFETSKSVATRDVTEGNFTHLHRRILHDDLFKAIGDDNLRQQTLVYVCGHPSMTDEFVEILRNTNGLDEKRVLCEKWW